MKYFYKINTDKQVSLGSGFITPDGYTEYIKGYEPRELLDSLEIKKISDNTSIISDKVQEYLNNTAQYLGYDDINSIAKWCGYTNSRQAECEALGMFAGNCWDIVKQVEDDVLSGKRTMPTADTVISELPVF